MGKFHQKINHKDLLIVYNKIISEFRLTYPKLYTKYLKLCNYYDYLIPHDDILEILNTNNTKDLINLYIKKIKLS